MPPSNLNRHSTAQTCFFKILHIISVIPADRNQCSNIHDQNCQNKDLNFDLNVSLRHPTEIEPVQPPATAECDNRSSGSEEDTRRDEGCLGLLIDAAQLILGERESNSPVGNDVESPETAAEIEHGTKRKQESWTTEFDGTLPALKSKRGRNLVLPEKYRDSFVEPLIRWTPRTKRRSKW